MLKKILVIFLALALTLGATACKEEENLFKDYTPTQTVENEVLTYGEKELNASVIKFSDGETPESLYSVFGEMESGDPTVKFSGKPLLINGKIVIGIKVGEKPRMAGVFVQGFGYFFAKGEITQGSEHVIAISNVPVGTFKLQPFGIVNDNVILANETLSFTNGGPVVLEGEKYEDFTLEIGNIKIDRDKYVLTSSETFAVAKNSVFTNGDLTATVKGDAGFVLSVYGTRTADVSKASYVYAGIKGGKVTVIKYLSGKEEVRGESAIPNYSLNQEYSLKVQVIGTEIKVFIGETQLLSVTESITPNRNLGFKGYSKNSTLSAISYPECTLDEYKAYALAEFDNLVKINLYKVEKKTIITSDITTTTKNYAEVDDSIKRTYERSVKVVNDATDMQVATTVFARQFATLSEMVMEFYRSEATASLSDLVTNWFSVIYLDDTMSTYEAQNIDSNNDGLIDVLIDNMPFNIDVMRNIDSETYDHRWWIPKPLRVPVIISSATKNISSCQNKLILDLIYQDYADALIRSTCQKALETYYAVRKTANAEYDKTNEMMWNVLWNFYAGAPGDGYSFNYNGPVTDYQGNIFDTNFRLSPVFYKPNELKNTIPEMVEGFNSLMAWLTSGVRPW